MRLVGANRTLSQPSTSWKPLSVVGSDAMLSLLVFVAAIAVIGVLVWIVAKTTARALDGARHVWRQIRAT
jgi:hypothetical protein